MYIINSSNLIQYQVKNFLLFTTTRKFFSFTSVFTNNPISSISREKTQCLVEFLLKSKSKINLKDKILLLCEQVHGNNVVMVSENTMSENYQIVKMKDSQLNELIELKYRVLLGTDGVLATHKEYLIIIFTADCVPLFVYCEKQGLFGLIHIGRKGLESGIINNLINTIIKQKFDPKNIKFILGPHICSNCYYVNNSKYYLSESIVKDLIEAGFSINNIYVSDLCTYHHTDMFFSYRRDKSPYRLVSAITPL
ncbi:MAG: polyphenol oxidase family protein [Endomicrobia bacterium]|nr:polyphenol oxidase family protein [Endomicrobiia bacterium]